MGSTAKDKGKGRAKSASPNAAAVTPVPVQALPAQDALGRDLSNWLFPAYLAITLGGFWMIRQSIPGNPNGPRSLFTAINAATLTGFGGGFPLDENMTAIGKAAVLMLVVVGSLFSMIVGSLAMTRILRLRYSDVQIIIGAFVAEAVAIVLGTALLFDRGAPLFQPLMQAASAFGNCGLYSGKLPGPADPLTHLVLLPLVLCGGLGLPVLMELFDRVVRKRPLSRHSGVVLGMTAWIFVVGFMVLLALDLGAGGSFSAGILRDSMAKSSVMVLTSRTCGLPIVTVRSFPPVVMWIVMALMAVGASSGGAGSGLKTTTLAEVIRGCRAAIGGKPTSRTFGVALAWLASYGGMVLGAAMLLSYVMPQHSADGVLFDAVSAASNVGFSVEDIPIQPNVFYALSAIMLLGRMAPLMVLWWIAEKNIESDLA